MIQTEFFDQVIDGETAAVDDVAQGLAVLLPLVGMDPDQAAIRFGIGFARRRNRVRFIPESEVFMLVRQGDSLRGLVGFDLFGERQRAFFDGHEKMVPAPLTLRKLTLQSVDVVPSGIAGCQTASSPDAFACSALVGTANKPASGSSQARLGDYSQVLASLFWRIPEAS